MIKTTDVFKIYFDSTIQEEVAQVDQMISQKQLEGYVLLYPNPDDDNPENQRTLRRENA